MSEIVDVAFDVQPFKDRLEGYAKENYKSFRKFEEACGLKHSGLSLIGKQGPTLSYLAKIADAIPDLNMNWLISGRGPMLNTPEHKATKTDAPSVQINHATTVNIGNWGELAELLKTMKS